MSCNLVDDCQNHFEEIDSVTLNDCVNHGAMEMGIVTREQVVDMASQVLNPFEAFMLLAFFEGIRGSRYCEILNLKENDFDDTKREVHLCTGRILTVSNLLLEYAHKSAQEYDYTVFTSDGDVKDVPFKPEDDRIIKCRTNANKETRDSGFVGSRMRAIVDRYGFTGVHAGSLVNSGRIEMIKCLMEKDGSDSYEKTLIKYRKEVEYRYGTIASMTRWSLKYRKFF